MEYDIVSLGEKDWRQYKALFTEMLVTEPTAFNTTGEEAEKHTEHMWRNQCRKWESGYSEQMFFAKHEGELIGLVGVQFDRRVKKQHGATIINFYVKKEFRGNGIGSTLLEKAIEHAKSMGFIEFLKLTVSSGRDSTMKIYTKFGFERTGIIPDDLKLDDTYFDTVHMVKKL